MGLNKAMVIGHLGQKPELRYIPTSGAAVAGFSVATLNSSFANSSLAIGLSEKAGIKETPSSFNCPLFLLSSFRGLRRKENDFGSRISLILPMPRHGEEKTNMINCRCGVEDVQSFLL
jgi:Single-strand binding protein family